MNNTLIETMRECGVTVGANSRTNCPFHEDSELSFYYYPDKNTFHCTCCLASGGPVQFLQCFHGVDFLTALSFLGSTERPQEIIKARDEAERIRQEQAEKVRQENDPDVVIATIGEKLRAIAENIEAAEAVSGPPLSGSRAPSSFKASSVLEEYNKLVSGGRSRKQELYGKRGYFTQFINEYSAYL